MYFYTYYFFVSLGCVFLRAAVDSLRLTVSYQISVAQATGRKMLFTHQSLSQKNTQILYRC